MIAAFSTSSPQASVALFSEDGEVLFKGEKLAPQAASGACMSLLQEGLEQLKAMVGEVELWLADLGPGSFTGTRVGVTLAKTFAFANSKKAGGVAAFDLVDAQGHVVLPNKRGEWFYRSAGGTAVLVNELPAERFTGYGTGVETITYPHAAKFASLLNRIALVDPTDLLPAYLVDPSISTPKSPLSKIGASAD